MVKVKSEQETLNYLNSLIGAIDSDAKKCAGTNSIKIIDQRYIEISDKINRNHVISFKDKENLCTKIYRKRTNLSHIVLPRDRRNTFQPYEQQLTQTIQEVSSIVKFNPTGAIQACTVNGVPDATRLRKLQRVVVFNKNNNAAMKSLTQLYVSDLISTRQFYEYKNNLEK